MTKVFILLGSNLGDKFVLINKAINSLVLEAGELITASDIFFSAPWGYDSTNHFYNAVIQMETNLNPDELLQKCIEIEQKLGRKEKEKPEYEDRIIDIDILFYGQQIIHLPDLTIPHPRMHLRKFTLLPLHQIAPDFIHPIFQKSISQLLNECEDDSKVEMLIK
jgi:2-amino-4-hydroxy-6-hydroxymethyldihydropteridine diphosphokinase